MSHQIEVNEASAVAVAAGTTAADGDDQGRAHGGGKESPFEAARPSLNELLQKARLSMKSAAPALTRAPAKEDIRASKAQASNVRSLAQVRDEGCDESMTRESKIS